jgi:hypothetical protein
MLGDRAEVLGAAALILARSPHVLARRVADQEALALRRRVP